MTVNLGTYTGNPKTLRKGTNFPFSLDAKIWGECSTHNPIFLVTYQEGIEFVNYCQAFTNHYYFVDDVVLMPGGRARIICREDVLMSLNVNGAIENVGAYLVRTGSSYVTKYMPDGQMHSLCTSGITSLKFDDVFGVTDQTYVMTVLGGAQRTP